MIHSYLCETWSYLYRVGRTDKGFDDWVNSLTNLELIQYLDNALAESV